MPSQRELRRRTLDVGRRLVDLVGPTSDAARQSLTALGFNSTSSFLAGLILATVLGTFQRYPTLLTLVPAAIGLRGNIMGGLGNRLSTAIHTGTFSVTLRGGTVLSQNVGASLALSGVLSFALAAIASVVASAFGLEANLNLGQLAMVSIVGGLSASVIVLLATVGLAVLGVRRNWDLDNLVAPSVSTLGDVVTVPTLYLASLALAWPGAVTTGLGWALGLASVAWFVASVRSKLPVLAQVCRESAPILLAAAALSTMAGVVVTKQLSAFALLPALLILQPAFVSSAGALGGILSSRLATKLHLGLVEPDVVPGAEVRRDILTTAALAVPVFLYNAVGAHLLGRVSGQDSPGLWAMVAGSLTSGVVVLAVVSVLAYYGTVAAWRLEVDPDTYGTPTVTATMDFVGVVALVVAFATFGWIATV
ncbi:MAG: magnesium transporter [Microthrixaceae bacterium]